MRRGIWWLTGLLIGLAAAGGCDGSGETESSERTEASADEETPTAEARRDEHDPSGDMADESRFVAFDDSASTEAEESTAESASETETDDSTDPEEASEDKEIETDLEKVLAGDGSDSKTKVAASGEGGEVSGLGDLGGGGRGAGGMGLVGKGSGGGGSAKLGSATATGGGAGKALARGSSGGPSGRAERPSQTQSGQLTAGEWNDRDHWGFWTGLYEQGSGEEGSRPWDWSRYEERWGMYARRRIPVVVTDGRRPQKDVAVQLRDGSGEVLWRARTDSDGRAELYPGLFDGGASDETYQLVVGTGERRVVRKDVEPGGERYRLETRSANPAEMRLDLMFVVDTTGSMSDELRYLQSELKSVVARIQRHLEADVSIRVSVNFYRDAGDAYIVKSNAFTTSAEEAVEQIGRVRAGGGGNYPEAVDRALVDAVDGHEWREHADARVLFLVGDAPPHQQSNHVDNIHRAVREAAAGGIRVVPVMGSGVDKSTEFLMRSLAIATGGTYVFLTDDSGIGGSHIEPTIGEYEVHKLNDLLVAVAVRYLR